MNQLNSKETFIDKIRLQKEQNLPFVIYSKPNSTAVFGFFQNNDELIELDDFSEKGFVFASFDGNKNFYIPENKSELLKVEWTFADELVFENQIEIDENETKEQFQNLVSKGIEAIENQLFQKVVLSRKESVFVPNFDLISTFEKLVYCYKSAFVYCFFHPKVGTWLGASPEQLIKANKNQFETIALAGTQKVIENQEVTWQKKEKEEQQFVTDYIVSKLISAGSDIHVSDAVSVRAGNLWHIKTNISGTFKNRLDLKKVIELLHPTPAVCGVPKETSKSFILENELYDRSFYTGFLGELNMDFESDLYVNLRCMQLQDNYAHLYMGCGITKDSIPEKEWNESKNKSMTMKKIL